MFVTLSFLNGVFIKIRDFVMIIRRLSDSCRNRFFPKGGGGLPGINPEGVGGLPRIFLEGVRGVSQKIFPYRTTFGSGYDGDLLSDVRKFLEE